MKTIAFAFVGLMTLASALSDKKIVCYYADWTVWRQGNGKFDTSNVDPSLCTHMIYSFVLPKADGSIAPGEQFQQFIQLRNQNPSLKLMVAIGGWNAGSSDFSAIAANPQLRQTFVQNVHNLVKQNGFDGFDMDWEYPTQRGGSPADKANFVQLLKELKEKLSPDGLLLSAAVAIGQGTASQAYDIGEMQKYLDFINLMAYDMHGDWETVANHHAPLYGASWENDKNLNIDSSIKFWTQNGAPAEKLVLGVPFYGKNFALTSQNSRPGAPAGKGAQGPYTQQAGLLNYNEICEKIKNENWQVGEDPEQQVPYAYGGNQWVGYDNEKSLEKKANYVNSNGLGGIMIWSLDGDDFRGVCGNEKFPLLKTINRALNGGAAGSQIVNKNVDNDVSNYLDQGIKQKRSYSYDTQQVGYASNPWLNNQQQQQSQPQNGNNLQQQQTLQQQPQNGNNNYNSYQTSNQVVAQQPQTNVVTQSSNGICQAEGYFIDPTNSNKYYYCQPNNGQFVKSEFSCSAGLVYDVNIKNCNWPK